MAVAAEGSLLPVAMMPAESRAQWEQARPAAALKSSRRTIGHSVSRRYCENVVGDRILLAQPRLMPTSRRLAFVQVLIGFINAYSQGL